MTVQKPDYYIIGTLALFFGWLLSFPFYGPVLGAAESLSRADGFLLALIFTSFHAFTLLLGGMLLRDTGLWKKLMLGSLAVTIGANAALLLPVSGLWPWIMAVMGCSSAVYILGWSCPYSLSFSATGRIKIMACTIIGANLVFIMFNLLFDLLPSRAILAAAVIPLLAALTILLRFPLAVGNPLPKTQKNFPLPVPLLLTFCLFVAVLYLNGGFMYHIMLPALDTGAPFYTYYRCIPYIVVLLIMYRFGEKLQQFFSLYMGVSLLGLAFVSFALLENNISGFLMTSGLIEAAFALLDLFVWSTLGCLAFIYKAPFQFFGTALAATVASITAGNLIGGQLLLIGDTHRMVTAILAAATIFLAFTVMPWLNDQINRGFSHMVQKVDPDSNLSQGDAFDKLLTHILPNKTLTAREEEITRLVLKGFTNHDIAKQLYISTNTLKTHLKHIYQKFNVKQKRELLSMAAGNERRMMKRADTHAPTIRGHHQRDENRPT